MMRSNALLAPLSAARFSALLQKPREASVQTPRVAPRLLVRDGMHTGAWMTLRGTSMTLGRSDDCDITLTDDSMPATAGAFESTPTGWHFRPAAKAVALGDAPPNHESSDAVETPATPSPEPVVAPDSETRHARFRRRRWLIHGVTLVVIDFTALPEPVRGPSMARVKRVALAAGATVVVAGGLLIVAHMAAPTLDSKVLHARESLQAAGFRDVTLRRGEDRQIVLSGFVNNADELARLKLWSQGIVHLQTRMQVKNGEELAQRVRESVGDSSSITVSYQSPGRVRVDGSTTSTDIKRRVQALVSELKGTAGVDDRVALVEPRQAPITKPLPVRIVSVMSSGRMPYFITDAGATYSLGSLLSDGSEVVAILPNQILFRLGDRTISYPLDASSGLVKP
jgi:hypothetical protein